MTPAELLAMLWEPVVPNALVDTKLSRAEAIVLVEQYGNDQREWGILQEYRACTKNLEQRIAEAILALENQGWQTNKKTVGDLAAHIARHLRGEALGGEQAEDMQSSAGASQTGLLSEQASSSSQPPAAPCRHCGHYAHAHAQGEQPFQHVNVGYPCWAEGCNCPGYEPETKPQHLDTSDGAGDEPEQAKE